MSASLTPEEVFQQLGSLLLNNVFTNALPVVTTALAKVEANPSMVLNPLTSGIFAAQFVADITATLPTIEASATQQAATLVQSFLAVLITKAQSITTTAASVGTALGNAVTGS